MKLGRYIGLVDLGILTVLAVAVILPPREMFARAATKVPAADQFALALAEARTIADPASGDATAELARRLGDAGYKDWAIEAALDGSSRAPESPTRWRALLAASVAYVDRLDVVPALDYANRSLGACEASRPTCPTWEEIRMQIYQQHLDAGVKSGIDPRRNPAGFRKAGETGLRQIRLNAAPPPKP